MAEHDVIYEFCKEESDTLYSAKTRRRRSVLLEIIKDADFNSGVNKTFKELSLNEEQLQKLTDISPMYVVPILFCSAIDLLGRVYKKTRPGPRQAATFFKDSAMTFFGMDKETANQMWKLRSSLAHQYSIRNYVLSRYGGQNVIEKHSNGLWVVSVRSIRGALQNAQDKAYEVLSNEDEEQKRLTKAFLEKHGFSYYLVV
jgi:hypothetical protein